jgi:hypothetical protein
MNKASIFIPVGSCIVALLVGAFGAHLYDMKSMTVYNVDLVNGCTRQPNGQVIDTAVAGNSLNIRVANKDAAPFASFALSRSLCVQKQ